jgi:hypothetical protein
MNVARWAARNKDHHLMKTTSMPAPASVSTPAFRADTVLPGDPASSIILEERHGVSRNTRRFFSAVRAVLYRLVDSSAFEEISSGREVSVIFTVNGPLIYRWESKNQNPSARL